MAVTARQQTLNLRAETIEVELPSLGAGELFFSYVPNGGGYSTELRVVNPTLADTTGVIVFSLPNGAPAKNTVIR